jgi:hypothetical protein
MAPKWTRKRSRKGRLAVGSGTRASASNVTFR